jgi:hypothetical protein
MVDADPPTFIARALLSTSAFLPRRRANAGDLSSRSTRKVRRALVRVTDPQLQVIPLTALAVLANRDGFSAWGHPVGVEHAVQVVDLVGDQAGRAPVEDGDAAGAIEVLVLDVDREGAVHDASDVEEAQAALVLLVARGLLDDHWIVWPRRAGPPDSRAPALPIPTQAEAVGI